MGELLEQISAESNLLLAWRDTEARRPEEPGPAPEWDDFSAHVLDRLSGIASVLRDGTWYPGRLTKVRLPKIGGHRVLEIPSIADRVAERAILRVITPFVDSDLQPDSYGFRPGLGVNDAIAAVRARIEDGADVVVRTDYVDCFARIPRAACLSAVARAVPDFDVIRLLGRCIHRSGRRGPPQGAPLSPILVNKYLDGLDRALWSVGVDPIRFADDIAIPVLGIDAAKQAIAHLRRIAPQWGMELSASKTLIVNVSEGVPFLGKVIGQSPANGTGRRSSSPERISLYVVARGSAIRAKGDKFEVRTPDGTTTRAHAARTARIICGDRIMLTTAVLSLASRHRVDVAITDVRNSFLGSFSTGNGQHKVRQAQVTLTRSRRLEIARRIVQAKVANQRILLQRTAARRAQVPQDIVTALRQLAGAAVRAKDPEMLIGLEGAAARRYFRGLGSLVDTTWEFGGRNRRPPRDPINAMLSYGYTLLAAECLATVRLAGLDPEIGVLHRPWRGRPSMALDLMEEFRPLIVDSVVLRLVGIRAVTPAHFTNDPTAGCRLSTTARRSLIDEYERRILTEVSHPYLRRRMTYREVLLAQAEQLARAITGRDGIYLPMPWR